MGMVRFMLRMIPNVLVIMVMGSLNESFEFLTKSGAPCVKFSRRFPYLPYSFIK